MKLSELKELLAQHADKNIQFVLPTGTKIPSHSHITDVARMEKRFVDCGGEFRTEVTCRFQTWFADDTDHRVTAKTLSKILEKAAPILGTDDLELEVEHEAPFISQFPITNAQCEGNSLVFQLGIKHTTCLASDSCGVSAPKKQNILFKPLATLQPTKCCN